MTHAAIPVEQRVAAGVFDDLVRVSCGIEDTEDLVADVMQALEKATVAEKLADGLKATNGPKATNGQQ
jgi:cystathionine gamma-lyase